MFDHHISHPVAAGGPNLIRRVKISLGNLSTVSDGNTNIIGVNNASAVALFEDDGLTTNSGYTFTHNPLNSMGRYNNGYSTGDDSGPIIDNDLKSGQSNGVTSGYRGFDINGINDAHYITARVMCSYITSGDITDLRVVSSSGNNDRAVSTFENITLEEFIDIQSSSGLLQFLTQDRVANTGDAHINWVELEVWDGPTI